MQLVADYGPHFQHARFACFANLQHEYQCQSPVPAAAIPASMGSTWRISQGDSNKVSRVRWKYPFKLLELTPPFRKIRDRFDGPPSPDPNCWPLKSRWSFCQAHFRFWNANHSFKKKSEIWIWMTNAGFTQSRFPVTVCRISARIALAYIYTFI